MTNPGSLTMGFARVDPRQLTPSVGTTQVESRSRRSHPQQIKTRGLEPDLARSRSSSSPQESPSPRRDRSACSRTKSNNSKIVRSITDGKELDDPEDKHKEATREPHSRSRGAWPKARPSVDDPPPPGLPPHAKTATPKPRPEITTTRIKGQMNSPNSSGTNHSTTG